MLTSHLTAVADADIETRSRSFIIVRRSTFKTFFSFNSIYDVYLIDVARLINQQYCEKKGNKEENTDSNYFGNIRYNHRRNSFRYLPTGDNCLQTDELKDLINELTFNTLTLENDYKTIYPND